MKKNYFLLPTMLLFIALSITNIMNAANSETTVSQVTSAVDVTGNVDYTITSTTPFTSLGSVNIVDTEHSVVIIKSIKPSLVIKNLMKNIFINGEAAANGTNCQVKMFGRGTIIFPYDKNIKPLTCYTETNYGGESCNDYSEGSSGGYMKSLTTALLNNQIRSFKLKRGYMVTFAVGTGGWGYSRCFIADMEDLEVSSLPTILDQRISSYRLFKWFNAHKAGLASNGAVAANNALNTSWCYDWAQGNESTLPDTEWVPNHIYEDYPSTATIGGREGTCHTKANNEPGNSADDHAQDVATVLGTWQDMMRTGLRLCSETSHDGSMNHLKAFIDSIDARGWRCDILDLHCYWASGFNNLTDYSDNYGHGRPIWISEWVWGASWNNNGIFGAVSDRSSTSESTQQTCYNGTKPILDVLNSNSRVERYAYWNSEANCSKIYVNNTLTKLGNYYSTMDVPLGYNAANEFIPKDHRMESLGELSGSYIRSYGYNNLSWSDPNGDLSTTITVQCKYPGSSLWTSVENVTPKDKSSKKGATYSYHHDIEESGLYVYRIRVKSYNNKNLTTNEISINVNPSQGTDKFQHGRLSATDTDELQTYFSEVFSTTPRVFIGTRTTKNSTFYGSNIVGSQLNTKYFTYQLRPWQNSKASTLSTPEEVPFMALETGSYTFGTLQCEVGDVRSGKSLSDDTSTTETVEVTFENPFPEGVVPVVLTEMRNPNFANSSLGTRVFDVTNTGFKLIVYLEASTGAKLNLSKSVSYFAIAPGIGTIDEENSLYIAAGHGTDNQIYGPTIRSNRLLCPQTDPSTGETVDAQVYLLKPTMFTALQTNNYPGLCQLRRADSTTKDDENTWTTGVNMIRVFEHTITVDGKEVPYTSLSDNYAQYRDDMGWVAVSGNIKGEFLPSTGIGSVVSDKEFTPIVKDGQIMISGVENFKVYNLSGIEMPSHEALNPGIYVIRANGKSKKVVVRY